MKRNIIFLLALIMICSLVACGKKEMTEADFVGTWVATYPSDEDVEGYCKKGDKIKFTIVLEEGGKATTSCRCETTGKEGSGYETGWAWIPEENVLRLDGRLCMDLKYDGKKYIVREGSEQVKFKKNK